MLIARPVAIVTLALLCSPASEAGEVAVSMAGHAFKPAQVRVKIGDTLKFVNDDSDAHNVFVPTRGHSVDLGKQDAGKTLELTVRKAGRFEVECVFHQGMMMTVEVAP